MTENSFSFQLRAAPNTPRLTDGSQLAAYSQLFTNQTRGAGGILKSQTTTDKLFVNHYESKAKQVYNIKPLCKYETINK